MKYDKDPIIVNQQLLNEQNQYDQNTGFGDNLLRNSLLTSSGAASTSIEDDFSDMVSQMESEGGGKSSTSPIEQERRLSKHIVTRIASTIPSASSSLQTCEKLTQQGHEKNGIHR